MKKTLTEEFKKIIDITPKYEGIVKAMLEVYVVTKNPQTKKDLEDAFLKMARTTDKFQDIRESWQPMDSKDGVAWFGGKNHYQLADYLPEEALEHNHEDLDFLVIGWRK